MQGADIDDRSYPQLVRSLDVGDHGQGEVKFGSSSTYAGSFERGRPLV